MKNQYAIEGDITTIFLNRKDGTVLKTIIDTSDFDRANEFTGTWYAHYSKSQNTFYVHGNLSKKDGKRTTIQLHRWLMNANSLYVDHKNFDPLDNRRSTNLRLATQSENNQNRNGAPKNSRSGIRGVYWDKYKKRWEAGLCIDGKKIRCGRFKDIKDAEAAVKQARMKYMPYSNESTAI